MVGATLGAVVVGVVVLFSGSTADVVIWALFAIAYQQFENYVVQPRIQSKAVQLDPFIVVIAALVGGTLLGVLGALLAIPAAATIQIAVREYLVFRREQPALDAPAAPGPAQPAPTSAGGSQ
jgi:predicted PurR-regulated permease PerM